MTTFKALVSELLGMFVDDGSLAFAILAIVAAAFAVAATYDGHPYFVGGAFYIGCLTVLVENVIRTARRS